MEFLFAPLEGITFPVFRKIHHAMFPGADAYYAPFLAPDREGSFKPSFLRERLPDAEHGIPLVPQILANDPDAFVITAEKICSLGYREINLNAGCPSGTVFSKHKGAGMLSDPCSLDRFLDSVFERTVRLGIDVSIKTRMGVESTGEFPELLKIYCRYPVKKLIIHARDRNGQYQSVPDVRMFSEAMKTAAMPVTYNGELFTVDSLEQLKLSAPGLDSVMIGRGAVANPALIRMMQGGAPLERAEMKAFHGAVLEESIMRGLSPGFAVERMKGLWYYMIWMFPNSSKAYKAIRKSRRIEDYRSAVASLFAGGEFDGTLGFPGTRTE